jgi:hypothetical protein
MAIIVSRATSALVSGTGTITTATNSTTVTGVGTLFTTEVDYVGKALYTSADVYIGTVATITSNTSITLSANAAVAVSGGAYKHGYLPKNSPLSNLEIDTNFINLNNDKLEATDASAVNLPNIVVRRDSSGNFAAGTITATLNGTASATVTTNNYQVNSFGVGTAGSGTTGEIRATNQITSYYSDERLKENIELITNALEKVMSLRGVTYNANQVAESFGYTNKEKQVGVLAADVKKVLPEAVKPAPFDLIRIDEKTEISRSGKNYETVQYEKLVPLLIEAIKEMQKQIEELKGNR